MCWSYDSLSTLYFEKVAMAVSLTVTIVLHFQHITSMNVSQRAEASSLKNSRHQQTFEDVLVLLQKIIMK